jgi:RING finger protein 114/RING finger protein 166
MPWEDPNIQSSNLLGHMQVRHRYDVDTYTDFEMNDEEVLRKVLEESK